MSIPKQSGSSAVDFFSERLLAKLEDTPALSIAYEAQDVSARVGFDFKNIDLVMGKVLEETREVQSAFENRDADFVHFSEEVGDCFFALVNLCRHAGLDPESLVRENSRKYLLRCKFIEDHLRATGRKWADMSLDEIYRSWKEAKMSGL